MILATLLFAAMGVCVKFASHDFGTAAVVSARGTVGALIMIILARTTATPLRTRVPMLHFKRGLAGVLALSMWFYSMAQLPLATSVTLNYMSSVWMAVFLMARQAWRQWHRQPHRRIAPALLTAVLLGFVGVALVLQPTLAREQWLEGVIGLLSGMLAAWAYLQVAALGRSGEPEHRVVFYFSAFGAVAGLMIMGAMHLQAQDPWHTPSAQGWGWLLGIGVFATLAQMAMTRAYAEGQALAMASLQYLGIVHAFILGVWFFDEPLRLSSVAGAVLIVVSGIAANRLGHGLRD